MATFIFSDNPNGFVTGKTFSIDDPSPTIMANGMAGDWLSHWWIQSDGKENRMPPEIKKPPYSVPGMGKIARGKPNGFKVVSTFSGCGGSCLGYKMAGFDVAWANEFLPAAQVNYAANFPGTILDTRDIKMVKPEEILAALKIKKGELDLLDGSPPCQAFSTAGQREKGWGKNKRYEHGAEQRNEELFTEYIRILRGLMPRVFVAENVSGLVKGVAKGFFLDILAALKEAGYVVKAQILDAQWLGVPQQRQRVIFVGVRNDLNLEPVFPKPIPYRYSVRDAIPWITSVKAGSENFKRKSGSTFPRGVKRSVSEPCFSVQANGLGGAVVHEVEAIEETGGQYGAGKISDRPAPTVRSSGVGQLKVVTHRKIPPSRRKRNAYNYQEVDPAKPCPAVTSASPGNDLGVPVAGMASSAEYPSGASVVHPIEKRKFTIDELKRICSFPDDFVFQGSYAQQWSCLGNSVPPIMMFHIASVVRDQVLRKISQ